MIKIYSKIKFTNNNYKHFDVKVGDIGYIIEIHDDKFLEVQIIKGGVLTDKIFSVNIKDIEAY